MADLIEVRGVRVLGRHGALVGEQDRAQPFEVDLDIEADLRAAGASDDLEDTIDYGAVIARVASLVETEHFALLEALAEAVANLVLADRRVLAVTVALRKLRPPVPVDVATVGVRVTRGRERADA